MSSTAQYKSDRIFPQTPACDPPPARRGGFPNVVRLIREHPDFIRGLALIILILTAYRPAFHAGWIWDDDAYITNNSALRTVDGLKRIWTEPSVMTQYYPLTLTSFWAEEHLFGAAPYSFHRDNIFIHACNAVLLWLILQRLEVPAAWLIAAVWAVHPVNVETVAWASERKNLLSGFFYLLATLSYLPFVINDQRWRPGRYFLSLFSFILALFAKTVAATFPAAMLLLIWWKRGRIRRRDIVRIVPFLVAAIPMSYVTSYVEHMYIGARGPEFQYSFFHRWLIAAHAAWFYIGKDLWPFNLSFIYYKWPISLTDIGYLAAIVLVIAMLFAMRKRIGRGPVTALLFFLGTVGPALGFVNVYPMRFSFVADHFQYLASIGVFALVICVIVRTGRWVHGLGGNIVAITSVAILMVLTFFRCGVFANSVTLWSDALAKNPDSWIVRNNVGASLLDRGENELDRHDRFEAARDFSAAQVQFDKTIQLRGDLVEPYINLARIEELQENYIQSEQILRQALRINNGSADVHFHLGAVLVEAGHIDEGIEQYHDAIRLDPRHLAAWTNLGVALDAQDKPAEAEAAYRKALTIDPDSVPALTDLGNALMQLHQPKQAAVEFRKALAIQPNLPAAIVGLRSAGG